MKNYLGVDFDKLFYLWSLSLLSATVFVCSSNILNVFSTYSEFSNKLSQTNEFAFTQPTTIRLRIDPENVWENLKQIWFSKRYNFSIELLHLYLHIYYIIFNHSIFKIYVLKTTIHPFFFDKIFDFANLFTTTNIICVSTLKFYIVILYCIVYFPSIILCPTLDT